MYVAYSMHSTLYNKTRCRDYAVRHARKPQQILILTDAI
jgi:hypothetical protein